jgi:acyl-homoserine-lactone acylase
MRSDREDCPRAEILWDVHDVPHVFADDEPGLFYACAWAQMRNHGNLILRLYAQARARAAELWGARYLASDRWVATMGVPRRAQEWLAAQSPTFRAYLDAFAAGINDYVGAYPEQFGAEARGVLPVEAVDVLAHQQRVVQFSFMIDADRVANLSKRSWRLASNAWALGPSRSASGNALLLTNPHLPWGDPWGDVFICFEAHLNAPGVNIYGIALVGFPVLAMAFNEHLGWSHTVNAYNGWTRYELELDGDGYRLDGATRAFETEEHVLRVKQPDGLLRHVPLTVRHSVHGPVTKVDGKTYALRVAGLDRHGALEQWWDMGRATNLAQFEAALARLHVPMFTVLYADRAGHILHLFNGCVPVRACGDAEYWAGTIPGNVSGNVWSEIHGYGDLPRLLDPLSGWLQNANDPPWTTTFPQALHPDDYPPYVAARGPMSMRAQRSAQILCDGELLSLEEMIERKFSTLMEVAQRILDELLSAARRGGDTARAAAEVLSRWDRRAEHDSRGAVLFVYWIKAMDPERTFAQPWDERRPLETPCGLADPAAAVTALETAAMKVSALYGALDVAWGEVFRLRAAEESWPAIGADYAGSFAEVWFLPEGDGRFSAVGGECYIAAVEFGERVRAQVLNVYGNATERGSCSRAQGLEHFSRKHLRPALLERAEIERNLASHEVVLGAGMAQTPAS